MNWIVQVLEALYGRFLLLDLVAKIVPGAFAITSTAAVLSSWEKLSQTVQRMPWWALVLWAGAAWTVAFALQVIGETVRALRDLPTSKSREDWYATLKKFNSQADDRQRQQADRLLVIKEACGNTSMAVGLYVLLSLIRFSSSGFRHQRWEWSQAPALIIAAAASIVLALMHREHVKRHQLYVEGVLK
jgi:hypothetical protein